MSVSECSVSVCGGYKMCMSLKHHIWTGRVDVGRCGVDVWRCEEVWGGVGRCGMVCGGVGRYGVDVGRCGVGWGGCGKIMYQWTRGGATIANREVHG